MLPRMLQICGNFFLKLSLVILKKGRISTVPEAAPLKIIWYIQ